MRRKTNKKEYDYFLPTVVIVGCFILTILLIADIMPWKVAMERRSAWAAAAQALDRPINYSGRSHVVAIDQKITGSVFVNSTALYDKGFVVVQRMQKDIPGEVVGVSNLLQPGLYLSRSVLLADTVVPGEELYITIYTDNGDGVFTLPDPKKKSASDDIHEPAMSSIYAL